MRIAAALLIILPTTGWPGQASPESSRPKRPGRAFAARVENVPGIKNVAMITPGLFRGGQPRSAGYRSLKERGFRTIISLREHHGDGKKAESFGLKWIHIPMHADITGSAPPTDAQIEAFFDAILDPMNQPVYFHCALGKDRTGTMAALYRMEVNGWTADEAIQEMDSFGAHGIYKSLTQFVKNYKPTGRRDPALRKPKLR